VPLFPATSQLDIDCSSQISTPSYQSRSSSSFFTKSFHSSATPFHSLVDIQLRTFRLRHYTMTDPVTPAEVPARNSTASPKTPQTINHRSSFADNLRHSPRSQRHPSFTQAGVQELINHPPATRTSDPKFAGRDWRNIRVGELVVKEEVRWAELNTDVQTATTVRFCHLEL
jgi:hypothetical protein